MVDQQHSFARSLSTLKNNSNTITPLTPFPSSSSPYSGFLKKTQIHSWIVHAYEKMLVSGKNTTTIKHAPNIITTLIQQNHNFNHLLTFFLIGLRRKNRRTHWRVKVFRDVRVVHGKNLPWSVLIFLQTMYAKKKARPVKNTTMNMPTKHPFPCPTQRKTRTQLCITDILKEMN